MVVYESLYQFLLHYAVLIYDRNLFIIYDAFIKKPLSVAEPWIHYSAVNGTKSKIQSKLSPIRIRRGLFFYPQK